VSLGKRQEHFSRAYPLLVLYIQYLGYEVRTGDAERNKKVFGELGESKGYGHKNSCHKIKLAIDLNITKDGVYLRGQAAEDAHSLFHNFWDMLGGSKRIPHDLNHYSFEHNGMR